jgi:hypothetical protein
MPDPKRIKRAVVTAQAKYKVGDIEEWHQVNALINAEKFSALSPEQQKLTLQEEIQRVAPRKVSGIFTMKTGFSFEDHKDIEKFNYGNILVEAHLPYCLHIPNGYELEVQLSSSSDKALLIPEKVWTHKATEDGRRSDETDFFADNEVLHFKNSAVLSPRLPIDPHEGWEQNYTGRNLQKIKEKNGRFRFSHLYIQFDYPITKEEASDKVKSELVLNNIHDKALDAVNKLIDAYRSITKQEHITRLGELSINMIYFIDLKEGWYTLPMNIETATMNRSKIEIEKIETMLEKGERPDLYTLLLLDAQNSFDSKDYALAIVQSFQGLEIFLETYLLKELQNRKNYSEQQALDYLSTGNNWKTKTRLKEVLKEATGTSLAEIDKNTWDMFCITYDTRNKVVHKGKEASGHEVDNVLKCNIHIIELLKTMTSSGK